MSRSKARDWEPFGRTMQSLRPALTGRSALLVVQERVGLGSASERASGRCAEAGWTGSGRATDEAVVRVELE